MKEGDDKSACESKPMILEFASQSDGKEALASAANMLFKKHLKLRSLGENQEEKIFTEAHMSEALNAVGSCDFLCFIVWKIKLLQLQMKN